MHSATTATGRPLPPPGKTLPKNRPAPLSCRAARQLAAPKPHVTSELQCYIPASASARHSSLATSHCPSNRHTSRLEMTENTNKIALLSASNRHKYAGFKSHKVRTTHAEHGSAVTTKIVSNRQWQILEFTVSNRKQTTAPSSNRHFYAISAPARPTDEALVILLLLGPGC